MSSNSYTAFMSFVLNDIKEFENKRNEKRVGFIERMIVKKVSPDDLHPNPSDEFCDPKIGPNDEIIDKYVKEAVRLRNHGEAVFPDPIAVTRIDDGYMILNGHHRWAAAKKTGVAKMNIVIVNPREIAGENEHENKKNINGRRNVHAGFFSERLSAVCGSILQIPNRAAFGN